MTWISFVCLLALTSSAFANYGQQGGYGAAAPKFASFLNVMRDQPVRRPILSVLPKTIEQPSYGQLDEVKIPTGYDTPLISVPRTLPTQGYGASPRMIAFDQPQEIPQFVVPTEADNLCRGQAAETVIPLDNGRRFIVCLDDGKGAEQFCPKGLFYLPSSRRCERKYGPQDYCSSQPCLNGGQCFPTETHFQCQCAPGFEGLNCELDARICQTQYPCGQSPDSRCQSFRLGAALSYICILQDGLAYGLSASQAVASPCQGLDGPQALSVSDKGFIMCDGERMFVESCPGGTLWDDNTKACVWPDVQPVPQLDQPSYSYGSYGQARDLVKPAYGSALLEQPKLAHHGHHMHHRKLFKTPIQGYGSPMTIRPALEQPKLVSGYGSEIERPVFEQPKLISGYGSQIERPVFEQPKLVSGYGSQIERPVFEQPKLVSGYGSQIERPVFEQPKLVSGYGSQITIEPVAERRVFEQPKLVSGYGSQITIEQPKLIKSSGY